MSLSVSFRKYATAVISGGFGCRLTASLLVFFVLGLSACTGKSVNSASEPLKSPHSGVFRMNLGTEPPTLDPAKLDDLVSMTVVQALLKGLTALDGKMKVEPAIAEHWDISPDGTRYRFHLRRNALWSDGKPVTASDFVYAWKRALSPEAGSAYALFLFSLKNAEAYNKGKVKDFNQVGLHALDPYTLQVDLIKPTPFFLSLTALPIMLPLREDKLKAYGEAFTEAGNMLSNGPYLLSRWSHEEKITLTPNPQYYDAKISGQAPRLKAVDMYMINDANTSVMMYENKELDFIETTSSIPSFDFRRLKNQPEAKMLPLYRINYFGFNTKKPPFNNPKVRQAFAYALDRSYYPRLMQSGQHPLASWIPPGMTGYDASIGLKYNPEKAKRLLTEAGYPNGKGFPPVSLSYQTVYDIRKEAEIAQYLWKKNLNVSVKLDNMEWKMLLSRLNQDPPAIFRLGWFADYPDADSYMNIFQTGNGNNHSNWTNAEYDRWIQEAASINDSRRRQSLYTKAQRMLLEKEAVIIPIFMAEKLYLTSPRIQGLEINALNVVNLEHLSVK